eukprot:TRINITY_DN12719_c0_g1_i1.p2 TRINITY_DN12719_c0_g1~~TRINITY_DN12719_c0_g1_i1.p2  ORF type:complete len:102 (+),score=22.69 TRINITY_DN12719_c0_g1_i1:85-390(+)
MKMIKSPSLKGKTLSVSHTSAGYGKGGETIVLKEGRQIDGKYAIVTVTEGMKRNCLVWCFKVFELSLSGDYVLAIPLDVVIQMMEELDIVCRTKEGAAKNS